jgi:hypothetical protein
LLAGNNVPDHVPWYDVVRAAAAIAVILIGGRFLLRPLFRVIGGAKTPEVFTTVALLIVAGTALIATVAGLSPSLGAFMAGVLVSESEYATSCRPISSRSRPLARLLLHFGRHVRRSAAGTRPTGDARSGCRGTADRQAAIAFVLAHRRTEPLERMRFGLALSQASEFSFVLFAAAVAAGALGARDAALATLITAGSMVATPILFAGAEAIVSRLGRAAPPQYDAIDAAPTPVIICGLGRFGQIIGRVLRMHGIEFTALERDSGQVEVLRRFGTKVYFGDPTRPDMLRAAGAEQAKLVIVAWTIHRVRCGWSRW